MLFFKFGYVSAYLLSSENYGYFLKRLNWFAAKQFLQSHMHMAKQHMAKTTLSQSISWYFIKIAIIYLSSV